MSQSNNESKGMTTGENAPVQGRREAIASRLRAAREAAGLSQGQVARELGLHRPTISEMEAGRRRVAAEELATFARLYAVSPTWLSCADTAQVDPAEDRLMLAARELSRLKPEDLNRLLDLLKTMRQDQPLESAAGDEATR
jgi:transcriptional regulator with XRE-family HTH domain